jgi:HlyD family secretion protein
MPKKKTKRKLWIWIAVVAVIIVAAGIIIARSKREKPPEVTTETIARKTLISKVSANGAIDAQRKVDLSANVMGQIVNLAVREGDRVEKGDFLLQIDQAQLEATAAGAAASLNALFHDRDAARASAIDAQRTLDRAQKSYADELIPVSELDRARTALESAEAQVQAIEQRIAQARANLAGARDTLSKTKMVAPIGGTVTRLPVEEGEVAVIGTMNNPGTVLMTISDMSVVEAVMEVDETDIPQVELGQPAEVTIDAYGDQVFDGLVTEVGSSPIETLTSEAINFEVKIQLAEPPAAVRPGFSCSADIITDTREDVIAAPIQSLVVREKPADAGGQPTDEEGIYVLNEEDETVRFAPVEVGITGDTEIEILSGLEAEDIVITGPFRVLREINDGDKVTPPPPPEEEEEEEEEDLEQGPAEDS